MTCACSVMACAKPVENVQSSQKKPLHCGCVIGHVYFSTPQVDLTGQASGVGGDRVVRPTSQEELEDALR